LRPVVTFCKGQFWVVHFFLRGSEAFAHLIGQFASHLFQAGQPVTLFLNRNAIDYTRTVARFSFVLLLIFLQIFLSLFLDHGRRLPWGVSMLIRNSSGAIDPETEKALLDARRFLFVTYVSFIHLSDVVREARLSTATLIVGQRRKNTPTPHSNVDECVLLSRTSLT
jgi:hypothetical protein